MKIAYLAGAALAIALAAPSVAQTVAPAHGTPSPVPHVAPPRAEPLAPSPSPTPVTEFGINIQGEVLACERVTRGTAAVLGLASRIEWFCYKP